LRAEALFRAPSATFREFAGADGLQSRALRAIASVASYTEADFVPSLIRFLVVVGVLVAIAYGVMFALVTLVEPTPREMTQTVSPSRLNK
jgi:hypothetical protein